jgi:hypothetical protein
MRQMGGKNAGFLGLPWWHGLSKGSGVMDFLVIDDDKTFRDATCYLIENEGHFAQPASSGEAALANSPLKKSGFCAIGS